MPLGHIIFPDYNECLHHPPRIINCPKCIVIKILFSG